MGVRVSRHGEGLIDGDIMLSPEIKGLLDGSIRGSIKDRRWPNGVLVYEIDSSLCKYHSLLKHES